MTSPRAIPDTWTEWLQHNRDRGCAREGLIQRDGLTKNEAQDRLQAQWPIARKRDRADCVIDNSGGVNDLLAAVNRCGLRADGTTW